MAGRRIVTNRLNLPETLVNAILSDDHVVEGTMSVTQLIDGPMIRILKKQYDYETDVVDNLHSLVGTALHHVLERANISDVRKRAFITTAEYIIKEADRLVKDAEAKGDKEAVSKALQLNNAGQYIFKLIPFFFPEVASRYIYEKRLVLDLPPYHRVSGTFDIYDKQTAFLEDYKHCKVYAYLYPESRKKWEEQTNIYCYMIRKILGLPTLGIRIIAMFKDWSFFETMKNPDYPKTEVAVINMRVWSDQEVEALITSHLNKHIAAERGEVVPCDGSVRWAKADEYAVKTKTAKRAHKVLDTYEAAHRYIKEQSHRINGAFVEVRPGSSVRCERFCPMNKVCPQYREELKNKEILKLSNS